jgi:hypothetical protein
MSDPNIAAMQSTIRWQHERIAHLTAELLEARQQLYRYQPPDQKDSKHESN